MPCCLMAVAAIFPRILLVVMWLLQYTRAFDTYLWPLLGFFFMPATTCAYAIAINEFGAVQGAGLFFVIIGVILDLGAHSGSADRSVRYGYARVYRR